MKKNSQERVSSVYAAKEAYRTIRTNLMFAVPKAGCKILVFTSSIQGEGKTTSSVNVAFSLAKSEKKVLLVDLDLRRPRVNRLLKLPLAPGMTNFISGFHSYEEILHKNVYPNLDAVTAGNMTPNPAEMASSEAIPALLEKVKDQYDYIILDTPPITVISDALPVIKFSDGVVLVVRPGFVNRGDVKSSVEQIEFAGSKVLGVIANGVSVKKKAYGRYGHYGYGEYGADEGEEAQEGASEDVRIEG